MLGNDQRMMLSSLLVQEEGQKGALNWQTFLIGPFELFKRRKLAEEGIGPDPDTTRVVEITNQSASIKN